MKKKDKVEEIKYCKGKKCGKVLPAGYKHKYCEACRNCYAENAKKTIKAVTGTVASVLVVVLSVRGKDK